MGVGVIKINMLVCSREGGLSHWGWVALVDRSPFGNSLFPKLRLWPWISQAATFAATFATLKQTDDPSTFAATFRKM